MTGTKMRRVGTRLLAGSLLLGTIYWILVWVAGENDVEGLAILLFAGGMFGVLPWLFVIAVAILMMIVGAVRQSGERRSPESPGAPPPDPRERHT